jgi:hypothetical protein
MFKLQPSCILLEIANVGPTIDMKQNNDDTDREDISDDHSEDPEVSTFSSNIKEDDLDNQQEVLPQDLERYNKILQTTRDLLPKKRNSANTVIACTYLQYV